MRRKDPEIGCVHARVQASAPAGHARVGGIAQPGLRAHWHELSLGWFEVGMEAHLRIQFRAVAGPVLAGFSRAADMVVSGRLG